MVDTERKRSLSPTAVATAFLCATLCTGAALVGCETPCEDTLTCDVGGDQGGASSSGGAGTGGPGVGGSGAGDLGASCSDPSSCDSGFCVDGVCCDAACDGACESCGQDGACVPLAAGEADPQAELCSGVCDGARGCSTLEHRHSRNLRTTSGPAVFPADVVVSAGGDAYLAGAFSGGQLQLGATYNGDFFVGRFNDAGQPTWVESWTLGASEEAFLGLDASDGLYIAGDFVQAGFPSGCTGPGRFLAKLNTGGQFQFCREIAPTGPPLDLAVLPSGRVAVGYLGGANNYRVQTFDDSGNPLELVSFMASGNIRLTSIVAASAGDGFLVAGEFAGMGTFAGHVENATGQSSGFVTKLDASLAHVWTTSFGTDVQDIKLATGPGGYGLTASFEGGVDLGAGEVLSSNRDLLVAVLNDQGQALWSQRFDAGPGGGASAVAPTSVAIDGANNVTVAGVFRDSLELGRSLPAGSQDPAIFLGKFAGVDGTVLHGRSWPQGEHNVGDMAATPGGVVWWLADGSGMLDFGGGDVEVLTDTCFVVGYDP